MGFGMKTTLKRLIASVRKKKEILPIERVVDYHHAFDGRVALIAGGSGGIGMAIARSLLDGGGKVVLGGTSAEKLDRCVSELGGDRVCSIVMDVSDAESIEEVIADSALCFGSIDIFVCCSGVHTVGADFWTISPTEFDRVMSVNLRGAFFACRAVGRYMVDNGRHGHILLVNSSRGFEPAWSPYGISKWGLRGLTQGLAQVLLPHGIVVNGVAPGSTATSLIGVRNGDSIASFENGLGRLAMPSEIGEWVKMLVGPTGDLLVGETVLLSGGRGGIDIR